MKRFKALLISLGILVGVAAFVAPVPDATAISPFGTACSANGGATLCKSKGDQATTLIKNIINLLIYLIGIISVIMIVVGGLKYTTSQGDQSGLTSAKNTILYAIVGLVVAVLSFSIVNFVIGKL